MKNFFTRLQSGSADNRKQTVTEEQLQKQLLTVHGCLSKMRKAQEEDFPLLNESTRLGMSFDH